MLKGMNVLLHDRLVTLSLHVKSKKKKKPAKNVHVCKHICTFTEKNTTLHGSKKTHTQMHAANEADEE